MEPLVCVARTLSSVTLEVSPSALPASWNVESSRFGASWLGGAWIHVEVERTEVEGPSPGAPALMHLTVRQLQPDTDYEFRLVRGGGEGGGEELMRCGGRTTGRPPVLEAPFCYDPRPDGLTVEWTVPEPVSEDAGVLECQLQCRADSWFSGWDEVVPLKGSDWSKGRTWVARIDSLKVDTEYLFRVRARNCAGWSSEFSTAAVGRTSERPVAPQAVRAVGRMPSRVTLAFDVLDPGGAPVTDVQAEVCSGLKWRSAEHCEVRLPPMRGGRSGASSPTGIRAGRVIVGDLPPGVDSMVRLWARSAAGACLAPSEVVYCSPSSRPCAVQSLKCTSRQKYGLEVVWRTADAEGAPVTECSVECCRAGDFLSTWQPVSKSAITRLPGKHAGAQWSASIDGLDAETRYLVRALAGNKVGWSDHLPLPLECQTAVRPPAPRFVRCACFKLTEVTLEIDIPMELAQTQGVESVSAVRVEQSGVLHWVAVPEANVRFAPPGDRNWWPPEGAGPGIVRCWATVSELNPGTWYTFRVWVANEVGFNRELPPSLDCHTAMRPEAPTRLNATATGPHSLAVGWRACDAQGAPLLGCEVQVREDSVLAALNWAEPLGRETVQRVGSSVRWSQLCDGLRPATAYLLRARVRNAVGWSEWSSELSSRTPSAPSVVRCFAQNGEHSVEVDVQASEPDGAPARACVVICSSSGRRVLAHRAGQAEALPLWRASLPLLPSTPSRLKVRVLNAVGWSDFVEAYIQDQQGEESKVGPKSHINGDVNGATIVDTVAALLSDEQSRRQFALSETEALERAAIDAGDPARAEALQRRLALLEAALRAVMALQERLKQDDLDQGLCFQGWRARCKVVLQEELPQTVVSEGTGEDELCSAQRLLDAFALLLEGGVWLERLGRELLEPLWRRICEHAEATPNSARVFQMWARQRQGWFGRFEGQLLPIWQEALRTALSLLAAVPARGDVRAPLGKLKGDLSALLALREACDDQLRKLRSAVERLEQVTTDGSAPCSFDEATMLDKISQTALSLVLSAVLPVPGSLESGVVSIGALWLKDDVAGHHVAVQHSREVGAEGPLKRFRQRPSPRAAELLRAWAAGGCCDTVLVHNAAARCVTVKLVDREEGTVARTVSRIQQAHPMVRVVSKAFSGLVGEVAAKSLTLEVQPAGVEALRLPEVDPPDTVDATRESQPPHAYDLEFAYGVAGQTESAVGRFPAQAGSAVSFVCLNREVLIDNLDGAEETESNGTTVGIANRGSVPVTFRFFDAGADSFGRMFKKPLLEESLAVGEQRTVALTSAPDILPDGTAGLEGGGSEKEQPQAAAEDHLFDVEVVSAVGKTTCNVRHGQIITYEGSL